MNGGLFFLGVFLGLLFIMATVLIMYYKQLSEGYDDKRNFSNMRKVGLEKAEIRRSVRSAGTHHVLPCRWSPPAYTSPLPSPSSCGFCRWWASTTWGCSRSGTLVSVVAFALIYAACYGLTARTYYRIVGSDD